MHATSTTNYHCDVTEVTSNEHMSTCIQQCTLYFINGDGNPTETMRKAGDSESPSNQRGSACAQRATQLLLHQQQQQQLGRECHRCVAHCLQSGGRGTNSTAPDMLSMYIIRRVTHERRTGNAVVSKSKQEVRARQGRWVGGWAQR